MQLKHLFVFLLMFLPPIAESTIYCQENTSDYYQSSKLILQKKRNFKNTKFSGFKFHIKSYQDFIAFFFKVIPLKFVLKKQILLTLKVQKQLHQHIALLNLQYTFLINRITASNSITNLYIA